MLSLCTTELQVFQYDFAVADPDTVKIVACLCGATAAGILPLLARLPSGSSRCRDACELRGLLPVRTEFGPSEEEPELEETPLATGTKNCRLADSCTAQGGSTSSPGPVGGERPRVHLSQALWLPAVAVTHTLAGSLAHCQKCPWALDSNMEPRMRANPWMH